MLAVRLCRFDARSCIEVSVMALHEFFDVCVRMGHKNFSTLRWISSGCSMGVQCVPSGMYSSSLLGIAWCMSSDTQCGENVSLPPEIIKVGLSILERIVLALCSE